MPAAAGSAAAADGLPALRQAARTAETEAARAAGDLHRFAKSVTSVAEAEEALDAAQAELAGIRKLQETLTLTRRFLEDGQDRVHHNIAPALAAMDTAGDNRRDGEPDHAAGRRLRPSRRWRKADLLSHGTAEQVYLMLRIALADHLTRSHDTCPLILDDVTVHADAARTRDILDLLLKIATERQITLFTQEDQIAVWAREHLAPPHHAILTLAPAPVS